MTPQLAVTYIALGSNLKQPIKQLNTALKTLANHQQCQLITYSSFYQNPALSPGKQDDYINAVAKIATSLDAFEYLSLLQHIEKAQGRIRTAQRWTARTLDLDILLYGQETVDQQTLQIPHPRMFVRAFVLIPLYEIEPELIFPDNTALRDRIKNISDKGLEKLEI